MEKLLLARDVAKMARWHLVTVYKKSAAGEIPGRVKLGASLRFKESVIRKWLHGPVVVTTEDEKERGPQE